MKACVLNQDVREGWCTPRIYLWVPLLSSVSRNWRGKKTKHFRLSIRTVRNQELCNNNPQQIQADVRAKPTALVQGIGKDVPRSQRGPLSWEIPNWLSPIARGYLCVGTPN